MNRRAFLGRALATVGLLAVGKLSLPSAVRRYLRGDVLVPRWWVGVFVASCVLFIVRWLVYG